MKKLKISSKESIRKDGSLYCLSDLFKLVKMGGLRYNPKDWAEDKGLQKVIHARGFFFKTYWASAQYLEQYAAFLTPGMGMAIRIALGIPREREERAAPSMTRGHSRGSRSVRNSRDDMVTQAAMMSTVLSDDSYRSSSHSSHSHSSHSGYDSCSSDSGSSGGSSGCD